MRVTGRVEDPVDDVDQLEPPGREHLGQARVAGGLHGQLQLATRSSRASSQRRNSAEVLGHGALVVAGTVRELAR